MTRSPFDSAEQITFDDFGPFGVRRSSSQITDLYTSDALVGRQVFAVTNFPEKQIGSVTSQCLVLGVYTHGDSHDVVLAAPERHVENGLRLL